VLAWLDGGKPCRFQMSGVKKRIAEYLVARFAEQNDLKNDQWLVE
jgi:cysteine synthase